MSTLLNGNPDPLENLIDLVSTVIGKRKSILNYSNSNFNHYSFYGVSSKNESEITPFSNTKFSVKNTVSTLSSHSIRDNSLSANSGDFFPQNQINLSSSSSSFNSYIDGSLKTVDLNRSNDLKSSSSLNYVSQIFKNNSNSSKLFYSDTIKEAVFKNVLEKKSEPLKLKTQNLANKSSISSFYDFRKISDSIENSFNLFAFVTENDFQKLKNNMNFVNSQVKNGLPSEQKQGHFKIGENEDNSLRFLKTKKTMPNKRLKSSKYLQKIEILNDHTLKPSKRITSFADEIENLFRRENFNEIEPRLNDFKQWKNLIKRLKSREDLKRYALSKKSSDFKTLNDLVEFIKISPTENELEKVWLIFVWITEHISYDEESYQKGKCHYNEPKDVLYQGCCTCEGYAMIFKYLCNSIDIECIRISGYSKGADFDNSKKLERTDHSWNAVKIAGRWELVDCTWGVGYVRGNEFLKNSGQFVKKFQPFYFFTPPQFFIYDHYSENYQLQPEKITLEQFRMLPKFEIFFHMYEIECISHKKVDIVTKKGLLNLKFRCPDTSEIVAELKDVHGIKYDETVYCGRNPINNQYEVKVSIPKTRKKFTLVLYGKYTKSIDELYKEVGRYFITFNSNEKSHPKKKLIKNTIALKNGFVFKPVFSELKRRSIYQFRIYYKNAKSLVLIDSNGKWNFFEKELGEKNMWRLDYAANTIGRVYLAVKDNYNEDFKEMCNYNIGFETEC